MKCHICNTKSNFFMKKDGYDLYRCEACELIFVWPQPEEKYLTSEVYSEKSGYQGGKEKDLSKASESRNYAKIFSYLERHFQGETVGRRLLDVGCSSGVFLYHAKKRGFETCGVELNPRTARIARGNDLNVRIGTLENARYEDDFFDVVVVGDVVEHVRAPRALLRECARILKKGGVLTVATPNARCFWSRATLLFYKWFGIPWSTAEPPYHLYQFSLENLLALLRQEGFQEDAKWCARPPRLTYELGALHLLKKWKKERTVFNFLYMIFSFTAYSLLYAVDVLITPFKNKDFSMTVIAEKYHESR